MSDLLEAFYDKYETREEALRSMANEEIDKLIESATNVQNKIYLSSFKK